MNNDLEILNQSAGDMYLSNVDVANILTALQEYYVHIDQSQSQAEHMKSIHALIERFAARIEANMGVDLRKKNYQDYLFLKEWILDNYYDRYSAPFNGQKAFMPIHKIFDNFILQYPLVVPAKFKKNLQKLCFYSSFWNRFQFEMKTMNSMAASNLGITLVEIDSINYGHLVVTKKS